ncbi:MAG: 4'-phosphopantetheinyl transferase superfamily protein [Bacteroidales bacterium]|nr:4'-phosphopantetheinyl transferase superfamily protein [Bacteroidales bacterium]
MVYSIFDNMERCTPDEVQRLLLLVPTQRREQALRFKHIAGQFACLQSFVMLAELLAQQGIVLPPTTEFIYNEHGKPCLKGHPDLHFNLSHCKNAIAVVVDCQPVGIDVERFVSPSDSLLRYTLNDKELEEVQQSANPDQAFTHLWTRKEALSKLQGTGLNNNLKQLLTDIPAGIQLDTTVNTEKHYICTVAHYAASVSFPCQEAER